MLLCCTLLSTNASEPEARQGEPRHGQAMSARRSPPGSEHNEAETPDARTKESTDCIPDINKRAQALFDHGRSTLAGRLWEKYLHSHPADTEAGYKVALCLALSGDFAKAINLCKQLDRSRPPENIAMAELAAKTLCAAGAFDQALSSINDSLRLSPAAPCLWKQRAIINFRARKYLNCLKDCDRLIKLPETSQRDTFTVLRLKATALVARGDYELAEQVYDSLISAFPDDIHAYTQKATMLWLQGKNTEAQQVFAQSISFNSKPEFVCAQVSWLKKHNLSAQIALDKLQQMNLDAFPSANRDVIGVLCAFQRYAEAENRCRRLIQTDPAGVANYVSMSQVLSGRKDFSGAAAALESGRSRLGDSIFLQTARLNVLRQQGLLPPSALSHVLSMKLIDWEQYANRAAFLASCDDKKYIDKEIADMTVLCEIGPTTDYIGGLLSCKLRRSRYKDLDDSVTRARDLVIASPSADNYNLAAGLLDHAGHRPLAREYLLTAIELDPEHVFAHLGLGRLLMFEHQYARAIPFFKKATDEASLSYDDPPFHLAEAYYLNSQPEKAKQVLSDINAHTGKHFTMSDLRDRSVRFTTNPFEALKALLLSGKRSIEERIESVESQLTRNSGSVDLHRQLCDLFFLKGDYKQALYQCDKVMSSGSSDYLILCRKAALYNALRQPKEAARWRKAALEKYMQHGHP